MKLRVPLSDDRHMWTIQASEDTIMSFYGDLRGVILKEEKLLVMGDFNARVARQRDIWNVFGRYGMGNANSNGSNLLQI